MLDDYLRSRALKLIKRLEQEWEEIVLQARAYEKGKRRDIRDGWSTN